MLTAKVRVCCYELHAQLLYVEQGDSIFPDAWGGKARER